MKHKHCLALLILVFSTLMGSSQTIVGSWKGNMNAGGNLLPLVFHITQTNQQWITKFDSPAQNALGIPTGSTRVINDSIYITIPAISGGYKGKLLQSQSLDHKRLNHHLIIPLKN